MALFFDRNWLYAALRFRPRFAFRHYLVGLGSPLLACAFLAPRLGLLFLESLQIRIKLTQTEKPTAAGNRHKGSDISNERNVQRLFRFFASHWATATIQGIQQFVH